MVFGTIRRLPADAHRLSMYLPVAGLAAVAAAARAMPGWRLDGWLLASLFFTTGAFVAYTIDPIENAFPLLMLAVGMSSILLRKATAYFVGAPHGVGAATIVAAIVGAVAIGETASFARNVDATRIVLDTQYEPALAESGGASTCQRRSDSCAGRRARSSRRSSPRWCSFFARPMVTSRSSAISHRSTRSPAGPR